MPAPSDSEEDAWNNLPCMDLQALKKFLADFPDGANANQGRLIVSLSEKVEAIRSGKQNPRFVIPFDTLGAKWKQWQQRAPEREGMGYMLQGQVLYVTTRFPGCNKIRFDDSGIPSTPTGDGSLVSFDTGDREFDYLNSIKIVSYGEETLYFAVMGDKGLVHIHGRGRVVMPDGSKHELE
jgi:hypothetical protein